MKVRVVVRGSRGIECAVVDVSPEGAFAWPRKLLRNIERWVIRACEQTANDSVCRSLAVEVHAEGADCDHEVPS